MQQNNPVYELSCSILVCRTNLFYSAAPGWLSWTAVLRKHLNVLLYYIWQTGDALSGSSLSEAVRSLVVPASAARFCRLRGAAMMWFSIKGKSSYMKETGTFVLALTVTVASSVFRLSDVSSGIRSFSVSLSLNRGIEQKEWHKNLQQRWLNLYKEDEFKYTQCAYAPLVLQKKDKCLGNSPLPKFFLLPNLFSAFVPPQKNAFLESRPWERRSARYCVWYLPCCCRCNTPSYKRKKRD